MQRVLLQFQPPATEAASNVGPRRSCCAPAIHAGWCWHRLPLPLTCPLSHRRHTSSVQCLPLAIGIPPANCFPRDLVGPRSKLASLACNIQEPGARRVARRRVEMGAACLHAPHARTLGAGLVLQQHVANGEGGLDAVPQELPAGSGADATADIVPTRRGGR